MKSSFGLGCTDEQVHFQNVELKPHGSVPVSLDELPRQLCRFYVLLLNPAGRSTNSFTSREPRDSPPVFTLLYLRKTPTPPQDDNNGNG